MPVSARVSVLHARPIIVPKFLIERYKAMEAELYLREAARPKPPGLGPPSPWPPRVPVFFEGEDSGAEGDVVQRGGETGGAMPLPEERGGGEGAALPMLEDGAWDAGAGFPTTGADGDLWDEGGDGETGGAILVPEEGGGGGAALPFDRGAWDEGGANSERGARQGNDARVVSGKAGTGNSTSSSEEGRREELQRGANVGGNANGSGAGDTGAGGTGGSGAGAVALAAPDKGAKRFRDAGNFAGGKCLKRQQRGCMDTFNEPSYGWSNKKQT